MPRDPQITKERLLTEGQRIFAEEGAFTVALRRVVAAAGQKNESALHYHFGNRQGLINAILARHNEGIESARATLLDRIDADGDPGNDVERVTVLVDALVLPWSSRLLTPDGQEFLLIVAQYLGLFDRWEDSNLTPRQALRVFLAIEKAIAPFVSDAAIRHHRVSRCLELSTAALGSRARALRTGESLEISHEEFVADLCRMCVGLLTARM